MNSITATTDHDTDVLIVGAGPVGLFLAYNLRRFGVSCRLIDKSPASATTSRALGYHPRMLEVLASLDILPALEKANGKYVDGLARISGITAKQLVTYSALPSTQNRLMILEQDVTERVLTEQLKERGRVEVERSMELVSFTMDDTGVVATMRQLGDGKVYDWYATNKTGSDADEDAIDSVLDGPSEHVAVRARFMVGCDGGRSTVRKLMNWKFEGVTTNSESAIADVDLVSNLPPCSGNISSADGTKTMIIFDLPNQQPSTPAARRVRIGYRRGDISGNPGPFTVKELVADVKNIVGPSVSIDISNVTWITTFQINERLSEKYVDGKHHRVMIAGDAAHCHSPAGGQGMNLGMQDAFNLAWKLALAVKCGADHRVLMETYEQERRPVAAQVIDHSRRLIRYSQSTGWLSWFMRFWIMPYLPASWLGFGDMALKNSQIAIQYERNALVDDSVILSHLNEYGQPGRRFPDAQIIDTVTGNHISMQRLLASGAAFHIVVLLSASSDDKDATLLLTELGAHVSRFNRDCSFTGESTPNSIESPHYLHRFVDLIAVTHADAVSTAVNPIAKFRDSTSRDLQKAISADPSAWPASMGSSFILVRPDGVVGLVGTLSSPKDVERIKQYLSIF